MQCGKKGHGRNPKIGVKREKCPAWSNKCEKCNKIGHFKNYCTWKPQQEEDKKKQTGNSNHVNINKMRMSQESGKALNVSQKTNKLIQKQQNMTKLSHETWNDKLQTFVKSSLPEEPLLKLRKCVDILSYAKHDPPLQCTVQKKWLKP